MARIISITSPPEKTNLIIKDLKEVEGKLELQVFRGVSLEPPGDLIKLALPNLRLHEVMRLLDGHGLGRENGISLSSAEPEAYIPTKSAYDIERDINEGSWEEMEMTISNDSNSSINTLILMFVAGSIATAGITGNSLHIVVGGMLLAPGFMPISRIALGLIGKNNGWYYGIYDLLKGYLALIAGAAITAALLRVLGFDPLAGTSSYYISGETDLVDYWTGVTTTSVIASAAAGTAGALLIATKKSVYTSGVMIALALVPTAGLVGVGLVAGEAEIVLKAFSRFALDVALVFAFSLLVFLWVRIFYHKRSLISKVKH